MSLFSTHPDFTNSAEEFYPHETLSTPMKLLSSLSSLIWCHINIINTHKTLMKTPLKLTLVSRQFIKQIGVPEKKVRSMYCLHEKKQTLWFTKHIYRRNRESKQHRSNIDVVSTREMIVLTLFGALVIDCRVIILSSCYIIIFGMDQIM
jgi:hypothetical protein